MTFTVRRARTSDVRAIQELIAPHVVERAILDKDPVVLYESIQQFLVVEDSAGTVVGCGAVHVMWEDLGEVRTLIVANDVRGTGVGRMLLSALEDAARELGLQRLFCLTFQTDFFRAAGYIPIGEAGDDLTNSEGRPLVDHEGRLLVSPDVYAELMRSPDEGIAEFLDLAHVKPNTLGNTRMLKLL
ncbi:N-acetylglutamate synthase [Microbacteriaceae bacterium MWH-Ta3]|nr:N-acetylglutamate synthase [Microbacteriaceae bacterium MWH-Ta3]